MNCSWFVSDDTEIDVVIGLTHAGLAIFKIKFCFWYD